jgi:hypothetical protein
MTFRNSSLGLDFSLGVQKKSISIDLFEVNQLVLCYALHRQIGSREQPSSPCLYSSWLWSQEFQSLHLVVLEASTRLDLPLPVMLNKMCHSDNRLHVDRIYPASYINKYTILFVFIIKSETGPQILHRSLPLRHPFHHLLQTLHRFL